MQKSNNNNKTELVLTCIDRYRPIVMDLIERELGGSENWDFVRSRLLKIFGDRGMYGDIKTILSLKENQGGERGF